MPVGLLPVDRRDQAHRTQKTRGASERFRNAQSSAQIHSGLDMCETSEGIAKETHDLLPSRSMVSTRSFRNPQKKQVMTEKPRFLSKTEVFKNPSTSRILHN